MKTRRLVIDFETTGVDTYDDKAIGIALKGFGFSRPTYITPNTDSWLRQLNKLKKILKDPTVMKLAWNAKFELHFIRKTMGLEPFEVKNLVDVQLLFHIYDEVKYTKRGVKLKVVGQELLGEWATEDEQALIIWLRSHGLKKDELHRAPALLIKAYAIKDVLITEKLHDWIKSRLSSELDRVIEIDHKLIPILCEMEIHGIDVDKAYLSNLKRVYEQRRKALTTRLLKVAHNGINLDSPQQVASFVYDKLNLTPISLTDAGNKSVDKEALRTILGKHDNRFVSDLLKYKHLEHAIVTFASPMLNAIKKDGRVHSSFNLCFTTTGRLSSSKPNIQNIEKDREKRGFIVFKSGVTGMDFDYDQIEMRLFAHYIGDQKMIDNFNLGRDVHAEAAKDVLEKGHITKKERDKIGKGTNFGVIYGMGIPTMASKMNISEDKARNFISKYLSKHRGIFKLRDLVDRRVAERGYVKNFYGRRRHLTNRTSYKGVNAIIQSTASYVLKERMILHRNTFSLSEARIVLQLHDELLFKLHKVALAKEVARNLEDRDSFSLPLTGNYKLQRERWFEDE